MLSRRDAVDAHFEMLKPNMNEPNLQGLDDPTGFHEPLDISGVSSVVLKNFLEKMWRIRLAEKHLAQMRKEGLIGGPVHLATGQEAIAVGVAESLRNSDKIFGTHRSHSHVLALGASVHGLFAEILGKRTGLAKGMGGSMHLWDGANGFLGSVPIVGGTIPLAVGAGLAAKLLGTTDAGVCFFGDGAVEEGVFHESLNLARILKAPVLFVVENNLFASHMHIALRQPLSSASRFAVANDIPFEVVDGNDVAAVHRATHRLTQGVRAGEGPAFLEAVTFRWYGHVDWREDIDVGVMRSTDDLMNWRARDPIARLEEALRASNHYSASDQKELVERLGEEMTAAWSVAMTDPLPESADLVSHIYSRKPRR